MESLLFAWTVIAATLSFYWSRQALKRLDRLDASLPRDPERPAAARTPSAAAPPAPKPKPLFGAKAKKPGLGAGTGPASEAKKAPPASPALPAFEWPASWEDFTAGQVFSWIGGFALFLGAAFFVKYSIERDLITPLMRVILGGGVGTGAVAAGMYLERAGSRKVVVTAHTLCAAGIGILYADVFAAHAKFALVTVGVASILMAATTVGAFLLSVRMDSRYIALLGLISGFLTPPLLSTGVDHPYALFAYIAALDAGIAATVIRKRWGFLAALACVGTAFTQWGWMIRYFEAGKLPLGVCVFALFPVLFAAAREFGAARGVEDEGLDAAAGASHFPAFVFVLYAMSMKGAAVHPVLLFGLLAFCGALLAGLAIRDDRFRLYHAAAGTGSTILLALWMGAWMTAGTLSIGLAFALVFGALHSAFPWMLERVRPGAEPFAFSGVAPLLLLGAVAIPILRGFPAGAGLWIAVLLLDAAAVAAAVALGASKTVRLALLLTMGLLGLRANGLSSPDFAGFMGFVGVFSAAFFAFALWLHRKDDSDGVLALPAIYSVTPFALAAFAVLRAKPDSPHVVFMFTGAIAAMNLYLVRRLGNDDAAWGLLGGTALVAMAWALPDRGAWAFAQALPWMTILFGMVAVAPFLEPDVPARRAPVWIAAALAGPAMFLPIHRAVVVSMGDGCIGVLPALFAVLYSVACRNLVNAGEPEDPPHRSRLAWFGGVALFFLSLIAPMQFDREWITLAWAFEGAALLLLYRKLPHEGLKRWAAGLFAVAFVRLALNPAVLSYHPRGGPPVFNWYLWVYGAAIASYFSAARLWRPREELFFEVPAVSWLEGAGTTLAFLLLNIEIADFFSTGPSLVFFARGNLAMDLAYTLGWGAFGIGLLVVGLRRGRRGARLASVGLLLAAVGKLFLHDIWQLGQLYRVASLIGLSGILIGASFLYQRFLPEIAEAPAEAGGPRSNQP